MRSQESGWPAAGLGLRMLRKSIRAVPEWSRRILTFRQTLELTQGELGRRLKTSAMAVSRWERGDAEPPADAYIRLGNIADDPLCWFFWGRAGLSTADVMWVLPTASRRLRQGRIASVQVVHEAVPTRPCVRLQTICFKRPFMCTPSTVTGGDGRATQAQPVIYSAT